jgi:Mor family transcriptional regulator
MRPPAKPIQLSPDDIERFWSNVDQSGGPDACWPWIRCFFDSGYGQFKAKGRKLHAHRVAYVLGVGPIDDDLLACHNCPNGDNRACCNPAHLWSGTHEQNMADMASKGRAASGDRHAFRAHPELAARGLHNGAYTKPDRVRKGQDNGRAMLTEVDVSSIRSAANAGESVSSISRRYPVDWSTVNRVIKRETWRHVA